MAEQTKTTQMPSSQETGKHLAAALLAHALVKKHEANQAAKTPAGRIDNRAATTPGKPELPGKAPIKVASPTSTATDNKSEEAAEPENKDELDKILAIIQAVKSKGK